MQRSRTAAFGAVKPRTHWRQSRPSWTCSTLTTMSTATRSTLSNEPATVDKPATKSTVDFVADLSTVDFVILSTVDFVILSPVCAGLNNNYIAQCVCGMEGEAPHKRMKASPQTFSFVYLLLFCLRLSRSMQSLPTDSFSWYVPQIGFVC